MGKQLSKVGMRINTRRQRAQSVEQHQQRLDPYDTGVYSNARSVESDRTILTLKLQRDEFTIYKGRFLTTAKKEQEVMKKLLLAGKMDSAKVLLKKKKYQEHLLEESQKQLNAILSQAVDTEKLEELKAEAEQLIEKNSEALKRIQMLLSLEDVEKILEETQEGQVKEAEINRLLLLASIGDQSKLETDLDQELQQILKAANEPSTTIRKRRRSLLENMKDSATPDSALPPVTGEDEEEEDDALTDTEQILKEKLEEVMDKHEDGEIEIREVASEEESLAAKAEDGEEQSVHDSSGRPSEKTLKKTDTISSSILPNVPTDPVEDKPITIIQEAETA